MKVKNMTTVTRFLAGILGLLTTSLVLAQEATQDIAVIRQTAEQYALGQVNLDQVNISKVTAMANKIDPRLRLAACDSALEAFSMTQGGNMGRTTVGVRCNGQSPWTLYVPVQVDAMMEVLTSTSHLQRGQIPGKDELAFREIPLSEIPTGYLTEKAQLLNRELVRGIRPGDVLTDRMLRVRELIKRGQEVTIHANSPGIDIKMNGIALENGKLGQLISVQNTNSGRTIQAEVQNDSTVVVRL